MSYQMAGGFARARALPIQATEARRRRRVGRTLGDVDVTSGVPIEGLFDFFSQNLSAPGDKVIAAWAAQVAARGNHVVRMPSGAQVGKLAERHDMAGAYTIQLAPASVLQADAANVAAGKSATATDQFLDTVQPGALLKDLGKAAGAGVSAITGIPTWAIPVLLIGGGAFVLISATRSFLPAERH